MSQSVRQTAKQKMKDVIIQVDDVERRFKDVLALAGVSLSIHRGEFIGLLGPNGAGKTTLIEILEGVQRPDEGRVTLLGRSWDHDAHFLRGRIGLALQETRFFEKLRVTEVLDLFGSFYGVERERRQEVLELIDLAPKARAFTEALSGGQRQRLALGIAVLHRPEILFLDEPTTGLDPAARRSVWKILMDLKRGGMTMLLTTHYMEEAEALADRILILDRGRFIASGTLGELIDANGGGFFLRMGVRPVKGFVPAFLEFFRRRRGFAITGRVEERHDGFTVQGGRGNRIYSLRYDAKAGEAVVHVDSSTDFLEIWPSFLRKVGTELLRLEIHRMTLDDLFLSLTGRSLEQAGEVAEVAATTGGESA